MEIVSKAVHLANEFAVSVVKCFLSQFALVLCGDKWFMAWMFPMEGLQVEGPQAGWRSRVLHHDIAVA